MMQEFTAVFLGIGLSAACGFRVFVPLLAASLLALTGQVQLSAGMAWIGTYPALIAFATATVLEIAAYYIPWLDHTLDIIATPAAIAAGTLITGALIPDLAPWLKWTLALILGGAPASIIQGATVLLRGKSSVLTAGIGNALVSTGELLGSILTSLFAALLPVLTGLLVLAVSLFLLIRFGRNLGSRRKHPAPRSGQSAGRE
jgi:hypothetical protein